MKLFVKLSVIALVAVIMTSCNQKELEAEIATLSEENEMLRQKAEDKDASLSEFFESMAQIRDNLREIKVRQNLITEETRDREQIGEDVREQIETDLELISNLMEDNRRRLATLNRQIRDSNVKIEEFENIVASLTSDIEDRNTEIIAMRKNIHELNLSNESLAATIDKLEEENTEKLKVIEEKVEQLNTAYYVFGTRRELQEQEIIDRQGGILGLGRTSVVNSNASKDYFTRLDITQVEKVMIPASKLKLVSPHPVESYIIETNEEDISQIVIENPEKFWSNTRYLVVSVD